MDVLGVTAENDKKIMNVGPQAQCFDHLQNKNLLCDPLKNFCNLKEQVAAKKAILTNYSSFQLKRVNVIWKFRH